jgi:dihydrodipicolinate synthase/N-acetylneuraminate lyase
MRTKITVAACTPLEPNGSLDVAGLDAHLVELQRHGMHGLLIGGTMGLMQLQLDATYRNLIENSVRINNDRCELMVGVGDTSLPRTRDRIEFVEKFAIDGIVVLAPYLMKLSQPELIDYFRALADTAKKPIYLYDLPGLTGTKLEIDTVLEVSKHPNIRGIKCSGPWDETRQLIDRVHHKFRVIPAQPHLVDQLVRGGVRENLDGIFGIAPHWTNQIVQAAEAENWDVASKYQAKLSGLLHLLRTRYTIFRGCELILNARRISGTLAPPPFRRLTETEHADFLREPLVQELLSEDR